MIKLAEFDYDGTIVGTEAHGMKLMLNGFKRYGVKVTKEDIAEMSGSNGYDRPIIFDKCFGSQENYRRHRNEICDLHILMKGFEQVDLKTLVSPGIHELLEYLKSAKIPCVLCTNSMPERVWKGLEEIGLKEYFTKAYSGQLYKHSKPSPFIYKKAMEDYGVQPSETIVFEDSRMGIEGGKRAGAEVIALKDKEGFCDQSEADCCVDDFREAVQIIKERNHG